MTFDDKSNLLEMTFEKNPYKKDLTLNFSK